MTREQAKAMYDSLQQAIDALEDAQRDLDDAFGYLVQVHEVTNDTRRMAAQKAFLDMHRVGEWAGGVRHQLGEEKSLEIVTEASEKFIVKVESARELLAINITGNLDERNAAFDKLADAVGKVPQLKS